VIQTHPHETPNLALMSPPSPTAGPALCRLTSASLRRSLVPPAPLDGGPAAVFTGAALPTTREHAAGLPVVVTRSRIFRADLRAVWALVSQPMADQDPPLACRLGAPRPLFARYAEGLGGLGRLRTVALGGSGGLCGALWQRTLEWSPGRRLCLEMIGAALPELRSLRSLIEVYELDDDGRGRVRLRWSLRMRVEGLGHALATRAGAAAIQRHMLRCWSYQLEQRPY
jgi:hypothetical protein